MEKRKSLFLVHILPFYLKHYFQTIAGTSLHCVIILDLPWNVFFQHNNYFKADDLRINSVTIDCEDMGKRHTVISEWPSKAPPLSVISHSSPPLSEERTYTSPGWHCPVRLTLLFRWWHFLRQLECWSSSPKQEKYAFSFEGGCCSLLDMVVWSCHIPWNTNIKTAKVSQHVMR